MEFTNIFLKGLSAAAKGFAAEVDALLADAEDASTDARADDLGADVVNDIRSTSTGGTVKDVAFVDDHASDEITVTSVFGTDDPSAIREMEAPTKYIEPIFVSEDPSLS